MNSTYLNSLSNEEKLTKLPYYIHVLQVMIGEISEDLREAKRTISRYQKTCRVVDRQVEGVRMCKECKYLFLDEKIVWMCNAQEDCRLPMCEQCFIKNDSGKRCMDCQEVICMKCWIKYEGGCELCEISVSDDGIEDGMEE